ncbi:hypothetical protein [Nocardiopsis algeriensis]|uniref:Uncharacterized protein n=1 Tax=Nocardiopsis algeriensis TaxID=1478215 RepID=A0A841ISH3_9ACTN|nr:hypothetical protein [Nocardiopsis algeriensis]MBB6121627.1 hypothetical protein [Nocardiopsis algeriensis]
MHTATRIPARILLLSVGAAGFVALGSGIAGAETLDGTDGLPLDDLGIQVSDTLLDGSSTPSGELVRVEPKQSGDDVQHQSSPAPGQEGGSDQGSGSTDLVDGLPLVENLVGGTSTIPMSAASGDPSLEEAGGRLGEQAGASGHGSHEVRPDLYGLDAGGSSSGGATVSQSATASDGTASEGAPSSGGTTTERLQETAGELDGAVPFSDLLGDSVEVLPMAASSEPSSTLPASEEESSSEVLPSAGSSEDSSLGGLPDTSAALSEITGTLGLA